MRRRRRSRGTWLPTLGTQLSEDGDAFNVTGLHGSIPITLGTDAPLINGAVLPVTFDVPHEDPTAGDSLADIVGSEYLLKRIVGKCFVSFDPAGTDDFDGCLVSCGFFVARAESLSQAGSPAEPIGVQNLSAIEWAATYNPLSQETMREPWIWRRTWILGLSQYPPNNALYGSVMDGPHIDAKTTRRISNDDRLWFAIGAIPMPLNLPGAEGSPTNNVFYDIDYRLFGSLRKAKTHGAF